MAKTLGPKEDVLITGHQTMETVNDSIAGPSLYWKRHGKQWYMLALTAFLFVNVLLLAVGWLLYQGIGVWGNNIPAGWGMDIINFIWWIGIGHAGTLISAILLLMRQKWRTSINRFAEAMTIFAVMCAGMYPLLHTGRPWVSYWLMPYPNWLTMWPQFRSPLVWDVFAVSTYFTVSLLYWGIGLIPDVATLRDRSRIPWAKKVYGMISMGWRNSAKHWKRFDIAYLILAGLSTPLVLSVHSIVSFDFSVGIVSGWHTTIFPPYFVAGAVYAGFAMVLFFALPVRRWYNLKDVITMTHIDWMCKIMLATGIIVFFGYCCEVFYAYYSGDAFEIANTRNRFFGPYSFYYWSLIFCNGLGPQVLWWKKARYNIPTVFAVTLVVSIGMWLERFIIIPVSLSRDFDPSSWRMYMPTFVDVGMYLGTLGFFFMMMFLFIRFLPMISIFEVRELLDSLREHVKSKNGHAHAATTGGEDGHAR